MRNIVLYFGSKSTSRLGTIVHEIAVLWLAFKLGHSPFAVSLVLVAGNLPAFLMVPLTGLIADRVRPLTVLVTIDVIRALIIGSFAFMQWRSFPGLLGFEALVVALTSVYGSTFSAVQRRLFANPSQARITGLLATFEQAAQFVAAPLAGVLILARSTWACLWLDAATYLVSACILSGFFSVVNEIAPSPFTTSTAITDGAWDYLSKNPFVIYLIALSAFGVAIEGGLVTVFPMYVSHLPRGPAYLGILMASFSVGAALAGLTLQGALRWLSSWLAPAMFLGSGLGIIAFTLVPMPISILPATLVGFCLGTLVFGVRAASYGVVEKKFQGRVSSARFAAHSVLTATVTLTIGGLATDLGVYWTLLGTGIVLTVVLPYMVHRMSSDSKITQAINNVVGE